MSGHGLLNIPFDEELLVDASHVIHDPRDVERRGQGNETFDVGERFSMEEVPHEVVSSKACANHINGRRRITARNAL